MSKSRQPCKPARLAGSGRKLVSALPGSTSIADNECMKASKDICLGLVCFHATFGFDDDNEKSIFHGFSPHEIRLASDTARIRRQQVANEHKARGFVFNPSSLFPPKIPTPVAPSSPTNESQAELNTTSPIQGSSNSSTIQDPPANENEGVRKNGLQKKGKKSSGAGSTEDPSRPSVRKFVLPMRSAHSSRIIKPNKRFRDPEREELSCDGSEASSSKKMRFDSYSDDSSSCSWVTKKEVGGVSDYESAGGWSSSVSTASSSVKDEDITSSVPAKVILRKAKLKVDSSLPPVPGGFSSGECLPAQKVVCGVCGAVRFYKYVMQARKFGVYSCESCRKFISKVIHKTSSKVTCKTGKGNCIIPPYMKNPITGKVDRDHNRCNACWLKICLHCYCMPADLHRRLSRLLPDHNTGDEDEETLETERKLQLRENSRKYLKLTSSKLSSKLNHKLMEQQIMLAKSLRKKAEALIRREATLKTQAAQDTVKCEDESAAAQPQARVKRKYVRKAISNSVELSLKRKRSRKDPSVKEEKSQKLKGPRVKHVCRSASLVLGQPVATFTDTSPSKAATNISGENVNVSSPHQVTSESGEADVSLKKDLGSRNKLTNEGESEIQTSGKMKCKPPPLPQVERNPEALLDGKARTLQDLTRQHYELVNGATLEEEHSGLIHIDFWESYDPDTVSKSGFALVGYKNSFNYKPVCFVCGCSGNDKVIHCACCCEPFHHYCVEGMGAGVVERGADWWLVDWMCSRCTMCRSCGKGGGNQVSCQRCRKSFHTECLTADRVASKLHSADRPWVCQSCLCCKSCNKAEVYKFVGNLPLCRTCFKLRQRGNFCPLCQSCYNDNDFDTKMMECERCKCWVHAKCEGLSNEKYHILSILPDSVEFVCRMCCKEPPAPWWVAVETEIKAGFLAVIKSLSKNRKACDLLKWSPSKRPSACLCSNRRFPDLSEQSDAESADVKLTNKEDSEEEFRKRLQSDDETLVYSGAGSDKRPSGKLYSEQDCSQQLKLDSDAISYQTADEKPPQFSPHATSQSDSGIGSTDDELKPTNDQCYCMETWNKNPLTLLTAKKKVVSNEYSSLETFNKEMEEMISSQQGEELMKIYHQTLEDVFPWFDPLCSEVFASATRVNNISETSDQQGSTCGEELLQRREIEDVKTTLRNKLNLDSEYYYNLDKLVDERMCVFCKVLGEGRTSEEGRLLYCGQGDWVHSNCALWSNEVFEEIDGALQNVQSAISRSRHIRCSHCMKKGASVGCCNRTCPEAYHFICARKSHCIFFEDKSLFCISHRNDSRSSRSLDKDEDFLVTRPIYVELDSKKKKSVLKQNVNVVIGSLMISSLGDIVPDLSDCEDALVPCNFQCTRMFWSSVEPWRLVQYTIRTKIVYTISDPHIDNEHNFTIDHCPEMDLFPPAKPQFECDESQVRDAIENLVESVCAKEDEDPQASTDLLPPELKDAIFEDLPQDLFDGISMQDIFPKLMNYDCSETKPHRDTKSSNCQNTKKLKPSVDQYLTSPVKNLETKSSKLSLSLKKKTKVLSDDVKRVNSNDEKENSNRWLSKIIQIDGVGDCSSDSSDENMSETSESFTDIIIKNNTKPVSVVQDHPIFLDESSRSNSECNHFDWKLGQVDGTMDFCSIKDNDDLEENPVKCSQCHRTYRTALSFERHLQTCSTDYILSCSESDSSEEDKVSNSETKLTDSEEVELKTSMTEEANFADEENNEDFIQTEEEQNDFNQLNCDTDSIDDNTSNSFQNQTIFEEATDFSSHFSLQSPTDVNLSLQDDQNQLPYTCRPKTIRAMIESNESQAFEVPLCGRTSPVTIRPVKTYVRNKKVTTTTAVAPPQQAMVEYQAPTQNNAPTLIIQSMPQNTLQYSSQIPLAIPISIQPVIPTTVLIQPGGMEQYMMNAPTQPSNVYITNVNQPMYVNMETTVMSSSQFVNGMSYSATTTQVYQTAKPMMPQSYVVVNTQNAQPQLPPTQTLYANPPPQPWTLNYQVKEKTTYEQVTVQPLEQDNCLKIVNSSQETFIMQKPIIKKVTVEKTHSFQRLGNVPDMVQGPYRPLENNFVHSQSISPENFVAKKCIEEYSRPEVVESNVVEKFPSPVKNSSLKNVPVSLNVSCKSNDNSNRIVKSQDSVTVSFTQKCEGKIQPSLPKVVSPVKPIITKIKSKPKVTTDSISSLNYQPKKICDILKLKEQISCASVPKEVKLPKAVTKKLPVQENRPKLGIKSREEIEKLLEKKRVPLKENKFLQKVKKINGRFKKVLPAYNLCDPKLVYEVSSQDGVSICSQDLTEAWKKIFDAVQKARAAKRLPPLPGNPLFSHLRMLGLDNNRVKYLIEQLPGAASCTKYKPTYHKCKLYGHSEPLQENVSGCARAEAHAKARRKYDMFSWLASRHRHPPKLIVNSESEIVNGISRRATSSNLPMAMRFRHLKETSKEAVGVFRSDIHGRGLFCLRDIEAGEMVIEYAGEVIRAALTDKRENYYTAKGIGCYMFRIDDHFVVDATMRGNAARFINHSCEPNCFSRVVDILGKKHILIFALHKIPKGEELTYDYKFPLEEDKIKCHCLSRKCRKYLN